MDAVCWAVYLDDRVERERWIDRDSERMIESTELAANVARILAICRQGMSFYSFFFFIFLFFAFSVGY